MGKNWPREIPLTFLEAQLVLSKTASLDNPVNLGDGYIAVTSHMLAREPVSILQFENDMRNIVG